MNHQRGCEILR